MALELEIFDPFSLSHLKDLEISNQSIRSKSTYDGSTWPRDKKNYEKKLRSSCETVKLL